MNKDKMFLLLTVAAVLAFSIPATLHANGGGYFGVELGRAWPDGDIKYTIGPMLGSDPISGSINVDSGFLYGFSIGSANIFGLPVRAEAEYFYRKHDISNQPSVKFDELRAHNMFVNIYMDMEPEMSEKWSWYFGGGVGMTQIKTQAETRAIITQADQTIIRIDNKDVNDFTSGY